MELTVIVKLNTPQDVKDFCYKMGMLPRNVSIQARHGNYISDARSILGMFTLDLSNPVDIIFKSTSDLDIPKIKKMIDKWKV